MRVRHILETETRTSRQPYGGVAGVLLSTPTGHQKHMETVSQDTLSSIAKKLSVPSSSIPTVHHTATSSVPHLEIEPSGQVAQGFTDTVRGLLAAAAADCPPFANARGHKKISSFHKLDRRSGGDTISIAPICRPIFHKVFDTTVSPLCPASRFLVLEKLPRFLSAIPVRNVLARMKRKSTHVVEDPRSCALLRGRNHATQPSHVSPSFRRMRLDEVVNT